MTFKDNFSETSLLFSQPVTFLLFDDNNKYQFTPDYKFTMQIPTLKLFYFNEEIQRLAGLLNTSITDLQKQFTRILNFTSHFNLIQGILLLNAKELNDYLQLVIDSFNILGVNMYIKTIDKINKLYIDDFEVNEPLFTRLIRIILMSLALKKQSDFIDDPQMREMQEKIDRIKNQGKNIRGNESTDFKNAFIILTYEFGYKPEEILNMTQYTINLILSYTSKSIRYKTTLIAAGNGNTKKVKFITDKGK